MSGFDEFVYLKSQKTQPDVAKWPADKPENGAIDRRVLQRHKLTKEQMGWSLNQLMREFPYQIPPEEPKFRLDQLAA